MRRIARALVSRREPATIYIYAPGEPAFVLLDFDTKGMSPAVKARLAELGGFLEALHTICPGLGEAGYISGARSALASLTK